MKKSKISIDKINNAIKKIVEQIEVSEFKPEMIVSINRGGCIPGVYLSHYFKKPHNICLLYTSPSPRDRTRSRMPSSA